MANNQTSPNFTQGGNYVYSSDANISNQVVGHPPSKPSGPHPALESLENLRYYQSVAAAALGAKK